MDLAKYQKALYHRETLLHGSIRLAEYLHEMTVFPNGKHDDQVDSTAQFLDWFKKPMSNWGIFEWTRQRAQAAEQHCKPQPAQPVWAPGCMEWLAEQEKAG